MQSIKFLFVGKTDQKEVQTLLSEYQKRLSRFVQVEVEELPALKQAKGFTPAEQKRREGEIILKRINDSDEIVLLDERGSELTSAEFATWIDQKLIRVPRKLVFVVGGAYGFSEEVYQTASQRLSLSKMTFNHQMVRPFLVEQVYRAFTILRGHPYHNQ
ncbi:MAG: 23S rRNA (pseudouridine(1915)-N(3))-methyltransferase RlmH [Porphyromonas sp.]|nr:23S rRNA (pseudouridine(1915)-N(3))-methyltransferase RlmH [Porphyromonas sp.]